MDDAIRITAAFVGAGAIGGGLLSLLAIITVAFPRVVQIEEKISVAGTSAQNHKKIWGNDLFGRMMRSSYVFTFLVFRSVPLGGLNRSAAQIGDVSALLPVRLQLWGLLPPLSLLGCSIVFLTAGLCL